MIKAILFDFFGVFRTDSYKAWLVKNNLDYKGEFAKASELSDAGKLTGDNFYHMVSDAAGWIVTPSEMNDEASVDFEMVNFARQLKHNYQTGLLSNAPSDFVRQILDVNHLNDIFNEIFISAETGYLKPHPEAFEHALRVMGVDGSEIVFIDDNKLNTDSAASLGIKSIQFTSVGQLKDALAKLDVAA